MDVFKEYKPVRNRIASLARDDSLAVIWAYCQYLQIDDFQFPNDIQVERKFLGLDVPQKWISEWQLELIAKEVILNGGLVAAKGRTLRSWNTLSEIVNSVKGRFANEFGDGFQNYVGDVIEAVCVNPKIKRFAECEYIIGKQKKRTVDWIVSDEDSAFFLECKSKRLSWGAKSSLVDLAPLDADIDTMAAAVVQIYKTLADYENNCYPGFSAKKDRKIYLGVVTLENWRMFGPVMLRKLDEAIITKLKEDGLRPELVQEQPYSIWAIEELEAGLQIVNSFGIAGFMDGKLKDPQMREWDWHGYMTNRYSKHYPLKRLFDKEYDEMFSELLAAQKAAN